MPELKFTQDQKTAWRKTLAPKATDEQWNYFIQECERRALIPGTHVVYSTRNSSEYNQELKRSVDVEKVVLITTINALRLIAERGQKYEGRGPFIFYYGQEGEDFRESKIPLGKIPHAVSVEMYRKDWKVACFSVARYDAYVQKKDDKPTKMWKTRGEEQCAKCCEAAGLRTVAPEECGDLYLAEEFNEEPPVLAAETVTPVTPPAATVAPAVNQAPAPAHIETTRIPPVAPPSPALVEALKTPPHVPAAPKPPSAPTPNPPAPAAPPVPKPASAPAPAPSTPPAVSPAPAATQTRQPHIAGPAHETQAELNEVADRIARDKDKPAPVTPAAAVLTDDDPPPPAEYQALMGRAAKILRDKLPQGGLQNGNDMFKTYLLKQSGAAALTKIAKGKLIALISGLENASAEEAATLVREGSK